MKRIRFGSKPLKQLFLAVPASALMLGSSEAQTTVGINFTGGAYAYAVSSSGTYNGVLAPQYFSGFPVTATAFGVTPTNWVTTTGSSPGFPYSYAATGTMTAGPIGSLTVNWTANDCWGTAIGLKDGATNSAGLTVAPPGNDQVTWGILDNLGWTINLSGLNATFTNGYVIQCVGAGKVSSTSIVNFSDGVSYSSSLGFNPIYSVEGTSVGLQTPTPALASDSIMFSGISRNTSSSESCAVAGFIVTDVPVITYCAPASTVIGPGSSFVLSSVAIGIGTLSYQWQEDGTNIPGATFANYTNSSAAANAAGNYQVIATSSSFPSKAATSSVVVVTLHAAQTNTWDTNTGSSGTHPLDGSGTWSTAGANWWNGSADGVLYVNDTAAFGAGGAGPYSVSLANGVTVSGLIFNGGNYTITNTSGQAIALQGSDQVTANAAGTITAPISTGTSTFLKAGAGLLVISNGGLTCGQANANAGTLQVLAKNGSDFPYVVTNGATLKIGYSTAGGYANSAMEIYGDGTNATTGFYLAGGATYNVSGTTTLLGAPTTIRQYGTGLASIGIFDIHSTGLYCTAPASGSVLDPNIQLVNDGYGMALQTDAGAKTATGDLILNGPLNINANNGVYGLFKRGTGSLLLNGVASFFNSALNIQAGSVICGVDECIGTNAVLEVSAGSTLYINGTSQTVYNVVTPPSGTVPYSPALLGTLVMYINEGSTNGNGSLTESDGGQMALSGSLVVSNIGGSLSLGDTYTLFNSSGGFTGGFSNVSFPTLSGGLGWTNNLAVDGTIEVVAGGGPAILTDLTGATNYAYAGGSGSFSISADGDPTLHYQWFQNGTIPVGADNPVLTLTSLTVSESGYYSVLVTNAYGSAHSSSNYLDVVATAGYDALVTAAGPVAFWPLNESSGTTAFDYWNGYDATYSGNYLLDQTTNPTNGAAAAEFDGVTGRALTPYIPALNPALFSAEAWVNPSHAPATTTEYCVLSCGQFGSPRSGWLIYQFTGYWNLRTYYTNTTAAAISLNGVSVPVIGSWTHLAVTWDGSTARLYVNGVLEGSQASTTTPKYVPGASGGFCIASRADSSFYWGGAVSDVALYNRVLTPLEILSHASNQPLLSIAPSGKSVVLTWPAGYGAAAQASPTLTGTFTNITGATNSPYTNSPSGQSLYFRLKY